MDQTSDRPNRELAKPWANQTLGNPKLWFQAKPWVSLNSGYKPNLGNPKTLVTCQTLGKPTLVISKTSVSQTLV